MAQCTFGMVYLNLAPGFGPTGDFVYVPDLSTLRPCPYAPGHLSILGWFQQKYSLNGSLTVDLCPRGALSRIVADAKSKLGVEFLVGIETEFVLLRSTDPIEPTEYHDWSSASAFNTGEPQTKALEEIADTIVQSGIGLELYHPEAAPGQYEVVLSPLPPLEAVDAIIHTRQIVKNIASKHGFHATLAPRIFSSSAGSSAHTHVSFRRAGEGERNAEELSTIEKQFLAGLMNHLPALPALTMPTPASYQRMVDGVWSGGTYVGWGTENREAPVRLCNSQSPDSRNFEIRILDGTANPYIGLAAMLGAGAYGIASQAELTVKDCPGPKTAAEIGEEGRRELGVTKRLPLTWEEGRQKLEDDDVVKGLFGQNFIEKYLSVNKLLAEQLENSDEGDEAKKLTRLVKFY